MNPDAPFTLTDAPHLAGTPVLTTDRLRLTAPRAEDWPQARDFLLSDRARFVRARDMTEALAWRGFCHVIGMWVARGYGTFILRDAASDEALGMAGPWHPVDWPEREIGWSLWSAGAEGRGLAFEAAEAARDWAFAALGWTTAVSYIDPDNTRSVALAHRLGARLDPDAQAPADNGAQVYRHDRPGR